MKYTGNFAHISVLATVLTAAVLFSGDVNAQASSYRLVGIVRGRDFTGAVLDDGKGGQILYQKGEQLPDGSRIAKVQKESVTISRSDGTSYDLFLPQNALPSAQAGSSTGSASGSASAPPQQKQAQPRMEPAPLGRPSGPSLERQEQGADTPGNRGKNRFPRSRNPRTS